MYALSHGAILLASRILNSGDALFGDRGVEMCGWQGDHVRII